MKMSKLETLTAQLREEHPNHCPHCHGVGGKVVYFKGDQWTPDESDFSECSHCIGAGKHPLSGEALSSEETIDLVEAIWDDLHDETLIASIAEAAREEEEEAVYQAQVDGAYDYEDY